MVRFTITSARTHAAEGHPKEALTHYLIVLKAIRDPKEVATYAREVGQCLLKCLQEEYLTKNGLQELSKPILALFGRDAVIHSIIGQGLSGLGMCAILLNIHFSVSCAFRDAYRVFRLLELNCSPSGPSHVISRLCSANMASHTFPSWHMLMVNNVMRNHLYNEAIRLIPAGLKVLEIGSGTGLLSVFAHRAGHDVIAIEESPRLCEITRVVMEENKSTENSFELVEGHSSEVRVTASGEQIRADVLVSEIFDCCGLGEGVIETFVDAHKRFLNPNPIIIPNKMCTYATLVQSPSIYQCHSLGNRRNEYINSGDNFSGDPYWCARLEDYPDTKLLSGSHEVVDVNLCDLKQMEELMKLGKTGLVKIPIRHSGTIHCIAAHFTANFGEGLDLDSSCSSSCWDSGIFPLRHPKDAIEGDIIEVFFTISQKGRRIDIVLKEEVTGTQDVSIVKLDSYRYSHDSNFINEIISRIPESASTLVFTKPFPYDASWIGDCFKPVSCCTKDGKFADILARKTEFGRIVPPYDYVFWWPILGDGTLDGKEIKSRLPVRLGQWRIDAYVHMLGEYPTQEKTPICVPGNVTCFGQLFKSDRVALNSRLQSSNHSGVKLKNDCDLPLNLFECRDINTASYNVEYLSEEFFIMDIDFQKLFNEDESDVNSISHPIEVPVTISGEVDGVLYWWTTGNYSTKSQHCAAFVFRKRHSFTVGEQVSLQFDLFKAEMLITLESENRS